MSSGNYPKGAGLGRDPNPQRPGLIDFNWAAVHGSRAQRREILRRMKEHVRHRVPGAREALQQMTMLAGVRSGK